MERLTNIGGWEADTVTGEQHWTDGTYAIHDLSPDSYDPTIEEGIEFYHPQDQTTIEDGFNQCRNTGKPYEVECRLITADDRVRWVTTNGEAVTEDGRIVGVRGAIQDITRHKEREQELKKTTRRFQKVLDTVEAAIFIKDTEGRYQLMNEECRRLLGVGPDEDITGLTDHDLLPADVADQYRANDRRVMETGETLEIEEEVPAPEGTQIHRTLKSPFHDANGELMGICAVSTDITDHKESERKLQQERDRLDDPG